MQVLFISKYIRTIEEGTPTRHYFFCDNLAKRGHEVKVIKSRASFASNIPSFNGAHKTEQQGNMELVTVNGPLISRGFSFKRLWTWITFEIGVVRYLLNLKQYQPDVVVVSSLSIFTFLTGIWIKRKYKIPLIVEVRDIYPLTLTEVARFKKYNPLIWMMSYIEQKGYQHAAYIVSSLDYLDDHVRTVISEDFKFKWIPTGFQTGLYEDNAAVSNETINKLKADGKFIVGYAGTIGLANALDTVFEAAEQLHDTHPNINFVFVGEGPLKAAYQERYRDLKNIYFVDFVKKQYLPGLLANFNVLVNTWKKSNLYSFGISPNKWNEYMYAGRPFILSHDYRSRIFDEAGCGWQIPTNNTPALVEKIVDIYNMNSAEIDTFGANGRQYLLDKLSYNHLTDLYEEVLTSAAAANK